MIGCFASVLSGKSDDSIGVPWPEGLFCVIFVGIKVQNKKEDISHEKSGCIKFRIHLKNDFNPL